MCSFNSRIHRGYHYWLFVDSSFDQEEEARSRQIFDPHTMKALWLYDVPIAPHHLLASLLRSPNPSLLIFILPTTSLTYSSHTGRTQPQHLRRLLGRVLRSSEENNRC